VYHAISPLGTLLSTLPVGAESPGATAGAPFELFYQPDHPLAHHRAAWLLLFAEHLNNAAAFAARLSTAGAPLESIENALGRHARRLAPTSASPV
jgi:hypothetical protein